jgi:predicted GNAT superfamily acetyltransferase
MLAELRAAADLQHVYWGDDGESVVPAHMMHTIVSYGGHVLAAMDGGGRMVGVLIGLIGTNTQEASDRPAMANLVIASKRMVVLPEYRSAGLGYRLKLAQRDLAIKDGIRLVTWTFDPLRSANAHLNLRKLGAISSVYHTNYYGTEPFGGLVQFGWSDRLRVDWWVTHRRVDERINGSRLDLKLAQYLDVGATVVNPTRFGGGYAEPTATLVPPSGAFALAEIPLNIDAIGEADPGLYRAWQGHIRAVLGDLLRGGFTITDFLRGAHEGRERAFYLLSANAGLEPFSLN